MNIPDKTEVLEALSVTNLTGPAATLADAVRALAKSMKHSDDLLRWCVAGDALEFQPDLCDSIDKHLRDSETASADDLARAITEDHDAETE